MAEGFYGDNFPCHSRGCSEDKGPQAVYPVHPEVFVDNWNSAKDHRKKDNQLAFVAPLNQCQCDEVDKKGWDFEEVLVTFSCLSYGQEPLLLYLQGT